MTSLKLFSEQVAYRKQRAHRIEALADGVFAIVMTLLVLDLRIPIGEINTENDAWLSLVNTLPKILTFVLSFSAIGLFWTVYSNQFNYIHTADRCEHVITLFYLLSLSLFPFTTSFLSEHLWSKVAVGLYISNILLTMLLNLVHWLYCYHAGLVRAEENQIVNIHKAILGRERFAVISHGIAAGCCFFSSHLALGLTFFLQAVFTFSGFVEVAHSRRAEKTGCSIQQPFRIT